MRFTIQNLLVSVIFVAIAALMVGEHIRFLNEVRIAREHGYGICGNPGIGVTSTIPVLGAGIAALFGRYLIAAIAGVLSVLFWIACIA
jgi:hypothetical protein